MHLQKDLMVKLGELSLKISVLTSSSCLGADRDG